MSCTMASRSWPVETGLCSSNAEVDCASRRRWGDVSPVMMIAGTLVPR